jgi:peptide/nickel transport system permease protein
VLLEVGGAGSTSMHSFRPIHSLPRRFLGRSSSRDGLPRAAFAWGGVLALFAIVAAAAPLIAPYNPAQSDYAATLAPMFSKGHLFGTDSFGRDVLSRIIYGARPLLVASIGAVLVAVVLGYLIGLVSGYLGGIVETVVMRLVDLLLSVPLVLFALILATGLGSGLRNLVIAIGISQLPVFARLSRALTKREMHQEYVLSARVAGFGPLHIALREITPNLVGPVVVQATAIVGVAAGYAAALSYLGVGIQPPTADWGLMAREGQEFIGAHPQLAIIPAIAITLFVVACNFLGDNLHAILDRGDGTRA